MNSAGIGLAVRAGEVDPATHLLRARAHPGRPVEVGDVARRLVHERPEVLAEQVLGLAAGQADDRVGQERQARIGADRPDEVRCPLDEIAVARLGFGQPA